MNAIVSALPFGRGGRGRASSSATTSSPPSARSRTRRSSAGPRSCTCAPRPDGSIPAEKFAEAIDERTALVCCTTISYGPGHRHDVAAIAEAPTRAARSCLADSYQAAGAIELDVRALGADFVTGGTVKYLLASAGLGFLWVRARAAPHAGADPDRVVRRRGHLPDGHLRLLTACRPHGASMRERRPCRTSTPASPAWDCSRRQGCRRSRPTWPRSTRG